MKCKYKNWLLLTSLLMICLGTLVYMYFGDEIALRDSKVSSLWLSAIQTTPMTTASQDNTAHQRHKPLNCTVRLAAPGTFPLVALVSSPGSGNTWVRHLLQQATGFYTGSGYNDKGLAYKGYMGELQDPTLGTTLTMKTHQVFKSLKPDSVEMSATAAIILIRNPFDVTITERNRVKSRCHVGIASWDINPKEKGWINNVKARAKGYMIRPVSWIQSGLPYIVVHYENILEDKIREVKRMTAFLNVSAAVTKERIRCVENNTEGNFHRKYEDKEKMYALFTDDLKKTVIGYMKGLSEYLAKSDSIPWERCLNPLLGKIPNVSSIKPLYDTRFELPSKIHT